MLLMVYLLSVVLSYLLSRWSLCNSDAPMLFHDVVVCLFQISEFLKI